MTNPRTRLAAIKADGILREDPRGDLAWLIEHLEEAWRTRYEIETEPNKPSVARIYRDESLLWTGRDFTADLRA